MSFLAMLIALAMQQLLHPGNPFQRDDWLLSWDAFVARQLPGPGFAALLTLAALLLLASWLLGVVEHWFFGLAELLLTAWIFLWSLGREDYHTALEQLQARQVGEATASPAVDALWVPGRAADVSTAAVADPEQQDHAEDPQAPDDSEVRQRKALERLTYAGYARWFAPLFFLCADRSSRCPSVPRRRVARPSRPECELCKRPSPGLTGFRHGWWCWDLR
jgi:membrane protein required for beta-lactamase induction